MFAYLLKRLLYLLPTVWLIVTAMFLLSKFIPGSFLDLKISSLNEQSRQVITQSKQKQILTENQDRYGADKPVFYFQIRAAAEPQTLELTDNEKENQVLKQWALEKGNWSKIFTYYKQAKKLQTITGQQLPELTQQPDLEIIQLTLKQLKQNYKPANKIFKKIEETEHALQQFKSAPFDFKRFIPVIDWQGTENQYHIWLTSAIKGDLGFSYRNERPVLTIILEAVLNTFFIMLFSFGLISILSVELSLFLAHSGFKNVKSGILTTLKIIDSIPVFLLTLSFLILFSGFGSVPVFPVYGISEQGSVLSWNYLSVLFYFLALPILCLTLSRLPYFVIQLYQSLQHILTNEYIKTARAKGLSEKKILRQHALRNAILPQITALTEFLPGLLAGSLVIEIIFSIPGIGRLLADSVLARDYPVVIGIVLFVAILKVLSNVLADILYFQADPKIKLT